MKKFLIVDDEPVNCKLLREMLHKVAYCDVVYSGQNALIMFEASIRAGVTYDFVLLDISMPEMDGLEVLEKMRSFEEENGIALGKGTPIVMVTAVKESFMSAFKKGAEDYLLKPIDRDNLFEKISEHERK